MDERERNERDYWEKRAEAWDRRMGVLERFSEGHGAAAIAAIGPVAGERVLDVGCGPGTTTLELARLVAPGGEVVGLDIAPAMVAAAERRAAAAGGGNARFVVHDLQEGPLAEGFDAAFSRFGVMFFTRPWVAFANLVASIRPGGRFACAVWGPLDQNPWLFLPTLTAAAVLEAVMQLPGPGEPGPFSLADREDFVGLLEGAGLIGIDVETCPGALAVPEADAPEEVASMLEIGPLGEAYAAADDATRTAAVEAVLAAFEPFRAADGWQVPGCSLIAYGRRPS